jgi:rhodanese-related sulfurtransferase
MLKEKSIIIKRLIYFISACALLFVCSPVIASDYKLIEPDDFKIRLDTKQPTILVDIQKKNAYKEHHFYGSIRTFAYPAKTDMDKESLVQAVRMYETSQNDVVIIGPRGGRASQRSHDFLITRGIPEDKIYILNGGIKNWPYKEMLLDIKGGCK